MTETIYERKYPHKTEEEETAELEKWAEEHPEAVPPHPLPPFSEFYAGIVNKLTYILLPDRVARSEEFIKLAIDASETYEIDTTITRTDSHISVTYSFDCGGEMDYLMPVLGLADTISFFTGIDGFDITIVLDYYTHAVYRGERLLHPRM